VSAAALKVISDADAIFHIIGGGNYAFYFGAGASVDAGVPAADAIAESIRDERVERECAAHPGKSRTAVERRINRELSWSDPAKRYLNSIQQYPNLARRLGYFRGILRGARPSYAHHAAALLVSRGYLRSTILTTNFDHLLESAFMRLGVDCQPLRTADECVFWSEAEKDRCFIAKLHGDIDTRNIANTDSETVAVSRDMTRLVTSLTSSAGLVVLGTSANEKSIERLFDLLGHPAAEPPDLLSPGLLWGVYMGAARPRSSTPQAIARQVAARVKATNINPTIVRLIDNSTNELFRFFPIWGIDEFMLTLVKATKDKALIGDASQHLDHEMRLREVFGHAAGLSEDDIALHLANLRGKRAALAAAPAVRLESERFVSLPLTSGGHRLDVLYGDICSRSLLATDESTNPRRAVVSPEDTYVSAGGGVAYQLLQKAGSTTILNELAKFGKVRQRDVVVTSGGALPIHYILHAAALEIAPGAEYRAGLDDVAGTTITILRRATALGVGLVWVPLLAAGVAGLEAKQSFKGLLLGLAQWLEMDPSIDAVPITVSIVIYRESMLPRQDTRELIEDVLGDHLQQPAAAGST
jgi:O-acetyl-ADP-ribose deacetylase (regulator of RNase III)